ncbi:MAG: outer membrane beta-barrel protein [Pseudomonadota bacterium]
MIKKVLLASLLAVPALASAQGGVYFTAGLATGSADLENIEASYGGTPTTSDDDVLRAVIGIGAQLSDYLGVEGTYHSNVENTVKGGAGVDTLEHQGVQLAVLGRAPLAPQFAVVGKLSANLMNTEYDYSVGGSQVYAEDTTGAYLGMGVGAEFRANDQVALRLMAERIMLNDIIDEDFLGEPGDVDVDQVTLSLNFQF